MSQLDELGFQTSSRPVKQRRGRGFIAVIIALAILVAGAWFVATKGQAWLSTAFTVPDYSGTGTTVVRVEIPKGAATRDIGAILEQKGVVKSAEAFVRVARNDSRALGIQPGFYRLRKQMSGKAALGLILDPNSRVQDQVTIPEGLRLTQVVSSLAAKSGLPASDFQKVLKDPGSLGLPTYAKKNAEGFLFPATYNIDPGTTAETLLGGMVDKFDEEADRLNLEQAAGNIDKSPRDVVIVASLIEAEVSRPDDYPKAARVIYNRLAAGKPLALDSTVHYAMGGSASKVTTTAKQRAANSPYNTYKHAGLPPGPIDSPGARALNAALHPARGAWMYFVTVDLDNGVTKFATTFAQHEKYVAEFRAWCSHHKGRC